MKLTKIKAVPGRLPAKRSINLATVGEQKLNIPASLGGIALVIIVAVLFSKIFVYDRLIELSRYEGEAIELQSQVDLRYARLEELVGVENEYAHYTLEAMTEEELTRCDRVAVLEMMKDKLLGKFSTVSWNVSRNTLTVQITGETLQDINLMSQEIATSPIVDFCTVSRAQKSDDGGSVSVTIGADGSLSDNSTASKIVTANINVFLKKYDPYAEENASDDLSTAEETTIDETTGE